MRFLEVSMTCLVEFDVENLVKDKKMLRKYIWFKKAILWLAIIIVLNI